MANRILTDTATIIWDFTTPNQAKAIAAVQGGGSGYGVGPFGEVSWDTTAVDPSVFTTTPNLSLRKPKYATVGWAAAMNANMDLIEALNVRLLAVEAGV
jgi:hypothetical protein